MAVRKEVSKTGAENVCNVVAENRHAPAAAVPIVGIGASAGGLEAFEQFFRNLAPDSGIGFVLVPHLDPGHASMLGEILQRSTSMPVVEVEDQMAVAPNRVHVVPPNRDMAIFHGILQLSVPDVPRGHRMPIDAFLRSLADDQGDRAIGVVLSGTGTDGTLGLRAILGAGGVSFVQEPASARTGACRRARFRRVTPRVSWPPRKCPALCWTGYASCLVDTPRHPWCRRPCPV